MLGGSVAGTAVAWVVASGSASADEGLGPLDLQQHAAAAVRVVEDTTERVTGSLSGKSAEAIDSVRSHESLRLAQPVSLPDADAAGVVDTVAGIGQTESESPAVTAVAAAENVATEVAATAVRGVLAPDGTPTAASPRATSGVDVPQGGTDGAPLAHAPASVPPVPAVPLPTAAASGCAAGSSLFPALIGPYVGGGTTGVPLAIVVPASECGQPNTAGSQPGTSPD